MEEYVKRMIIERETLSEKITKLADFILSDKFSKVERKERRMMNRQLKHMSRYREVLNDRIALHCTIEEDAAYVHLLDNPEPPQPEKPKSKTKKKKEDGSKEN